MVELAKISVYVLCILTAGTCSGLLIRGYSRGGVRLLLWSAICFGFLAIHSVIVLVELVLLPATDLQMLRHLASFAAVGFLLFGLVWETE